MAEDILIRKPFEFLTDVPVSLADENAILSGKRAMEEFSDGAVVGGVLGGGND